MPGLSPDIEETLADHVGAIVANARIPAADREDVAEELRGHLAQAVTAGVAEGLEPHEATTRAIASFGGSDAVSRDFMVTYRGRLWASTIGQLLPVASEAAGPPGLIVWLARFDAFIAILSGMGAAALLAYESPGRAVAGAVLGGATAIMLAIAATALRRGQGWAVPVSTFVCLVNAVIFLASLGQPPGGFTISVNGLIGAVLLLRAWANLRVLDEWTAGSRPISWRLGVPVGLVLIGWSVVAGLAPDLPDPTQIGPSDIHASATVSCAAPGPTFDLRVTYDRVDLWPRGVLRSDGNWYGDVLQLEPGYFDVAPGDVRATATSGNGPTVPIDVTSLSAVPPELSSVDGQRTIVGEIRGADQQAGRTVRVIVPTTPIVGDDGAPNEVRPLEGIVATIRLYHLDRFVLQGFAECEKPLTLEPRG